MNRRHRRAAFVRRLAAGGARVSAATDAHITTTSTTTTGARTIGVRVRTDVTD